MLNASQDIRDAYFTALNNQINLSDGSKLAIYRNYPFQATLPDKYLYIRDVFDTNVENDSKFIREGLIELELYVRQYRYEDVSIAENIVGSILNRILPVIGGSNLVGSTYDFGHVYLEDNRTLYEVDDKGYYITRKILTFRQLLSQKNS